MKERIPFLLVGLRLLLALVFVVGYFARAPAWIYVAALVIGIVSDIFDGVLARRWGTSTPLLRRCDSNTDTIFYGCSGLAAVLMQAAWLKPWWPVIALMFFLMVAQNVVNTIKYRKQPAYHMWSGKLWSISLVITLITLFLDRPSAWAMNTMIALAVYNSLEDIIATLLLPRAMVDIPTVFHAARIARGERRS